MAYALKLNGNVQPLTKEISDTCYSLNYEIIFINDGSTDGTESKLINLKHKYDNLRVITHNKSLGQSFAIKTGVLHAQYDIIVTLDGDCQNDPADIPRLLSKFKIEILYKRMNAIFLLKARILSSSQNPKKKTN